MKALNFLFLALLVAFNVSAQSDDVYFSPEDNYVEQEKIKPEENTPPSDQQQYKQEKKQDYDYDDYSYGDYDDYSDSESYSDGNGNTYITNNYYGDSYNDYDYSTRMRRYYSPYYGFDYYSPCYTGYYNSWYGGSFSISWGIPYYYYGYYSSSYYDPWYCNYYDPFSHCYGGWYGYNSYSGYGGYNHGYNHGYYNGYNHGFYDGYYGSGYNNSASSSGGRGHYYGPQYKSSGTSTRNGYEEMKSSGDKGMIIKEEKASPRVDYGNNEIKSIRTEEKATPAPQNDKPVMNNNRNESDYQRYDKPNDTQRAEPVSPNQKPSYEERGTINRNIEPQRPTYEKDKQADKPSNRNQPDGNKTISPQRNKDNSYQRKDPTPAPNNQRNNYNENYQQKDPSPSPAPNYQRNNNAAPQNYEPPRQQTSPSRNNYQQKSTPNVKPNRGGSYVPENNSNQFVQKQLYNNQVARNTPSMERAKAPAVNNNNSVTKQVVRGSFSPSANSSSNNQKSRTLSTGMMRIEK